MPSPATAMTLVAPAIARAVRDKGGRDDTSGAAGAVRDERCGLKGEESGNVVILP